MNNDLAESRKGRTLVSLEGQLMEARLNGGTGEGIERVVALEHARLENKLCRLRDEDAQAGIDRTFLLCIRIDKWGTHTELSAE